MAAKRAHYTSAGVLVHEFDNAQVSDTRLTFTLTDLVHSAIGELDTVLPVLLCHQLFDFLRSDIEVIFEARAEIELVISLSVVFVQSEVGAWLCTLSSLRPNLAARVFWSSDRASSAVRDLTGAHRSSAGGGGRLAW